MNNNEDNFALPEEPIKSDAPYVAEQFPQVDPDQVEKELIGQFKEMQENMPHQDVAAHFFKMYAPIYKQLLDGLSNKDARRVAWHVVQWPLEDEHPKFNDEKAKQAFAVGIRLNDCKMIMRSFVEMERQQEIQVQKAKAELEAAANKELEEAGLNTSSTPTSTFASRETQGEEDGK